MAESRRRSPTAEILFQGQSIGPDLLPSLWRDGVERKTKYTRMRIAKARGLRLKTMGVTLRPSWVRRHPEAADWVVKYLPERRTLERDLIAATGSVEPYYDRVPIGKARDMDFDNAEACANYMETWRKESVPYHTFVEKGSEDGPYGLAILPSDADLGGCPDFYDRLDEAAYAALDDEKRSEYSLDEDDPKRRYAGRDKDGSKRPNPRYDRDKQGKPRGRGASAFERDDEKSKQAHEDAVQRYLLGQEQGACSIRVIPANDAIPYLVKGTKRRRWQLRALLERTLYAPEELLTKGYGWRGMGDRLLTPQGYEEGRETGQNGMFYLYVLYLVHIDPKDPARIERPIIVYSVGGQPSWMGGDPPEGDTLPDNGVAVIDLYETHGLTGPFWWWGGGLHTSDDDPDFYWEPYLWPFTETILGIEGLQTMANAATAVQAVTGYYHRPDAALVALDDEALIDAQTKTLRVPKIPDAGEIETVIGEIVPASPAQVSPDLWRVIQLEMASLRENTILEQPGGSDSASGRSMVVKETIAQTAKRQTREDALDATRFCGERAMRIFEAVEREFGYRWPLQTSKQAPVGSKLDTVSDTLVWDSAWVGDGEYRLTCDYPSEPDPIKTEQAMSAIGAGIGSFDAYCEAQGITDVESEWARVLKTQMRMMPEYRQALLTRLAKRQGNTLMMEVLKLQQQQRMTQQGAPGFEEGMPAAALQRGGETASAGIGGGPTTVQRSLGGTMAAATAPQQQESMLQNQLPGAA